jgi:hypothetical protein
LDDEFEFDFDALDDVDPLEIVLFRFLETNTGDDSFEPRIAFLLDLLDEYDEADDLFPPAVMVVPNADLAKLGQRMLSLKLADSKR